ncbi:MAG: hypothetical protein LCH56_03365 [Proteobacteria bacterium]|nr:hypothetical protein [Pseudomonadota bacterium]
MDNQTREGVGDPAEFAAASAKLTDVPQGAFALAGTAVGLLVIGWLLVYFLIFLPRGPVG